MDKLYDVWNWIDETFINLFNKKIKNPFLDWFFPIYTQLAGLIVLIPVITLGVILADDPHLKTFFISLGFTELLVAAIVHIIKFLSFRDRPYESYEGINDSGIRHIDKSFPSGHTAASFTVFMFILFFYPSFWPIYLIYAILIGISRIYLGVHFPTDVFGGIIVAVLVSILSYKFILPWLVPIIFNFIDNIF